MLLKDIIEQGRKTLSATYSEGEAREMVFAYMEDVFGFKRHIHIVEPDRQLSEEDAARTLADFRRMACGEPLQYVTGIAHFYGRQFRVTTDVLIPRQETELLCKDVLHESDYLCVRKGLWPNGSKILDMCTGSGCIAWTLALEIPGAQVSAVDISEGALEVAASQNFKEEISSTGAQNPMFLKADVLQGPEKCPEVSSAGKFDIIVSNPPYVMYSEKASMRTNVLNHEPHLALFVPDEDPLKFYRAVARWAAVLLKDDGTGIVEINEALGKETAELFREAGFDNAEIIKDLNEKDRFVRFSKYL